MSASTEKTVKHTPGPWEWGSTGMGYAVKGDGGGHTVVFTNTASCSKAALRRNVTKDDEEQANACLIAAAPELLANLEFAVKLLGSFPAVSGTAQVEHMRNVIAKARGQ